MDTVKTKIYKWLPIVFGCHCRDDRSFHYKNQKFPICARCTGEFIGICLGIGGWFLIQCPIVLYILMLIPLIIDGVIQMVTSYESHNIRRLWTGLLFGYGFVSIFMITNVWCFEFGVDIAKNLK